MSEKTQFLADDILDHLRNGTAWTQPTAIYLALFIGDPGLVGNAATEVDPTPTTGDDTAYARQAITFGTAASAGSISNTAAVTFPAVVLVGGDYTVTHVGICLSATEGANDVMYVSALPAAKTLTTSEQLTFAIGDLTINET